MFKKKCSKCQRKISKSYDFCPFCGNNLKSKYNEQDYGMLGKNDFIQDNSIPESELSLGKIFKTAIKELPAMIKIIEKQMQEAENQPKQNNPYLKNNLRIQFFVNGKNINHGIRQNQIIKPQEIKNKFSKQKLEKFVKLPKKEPTSKLRRFSNKVIYEFKIPGVKNINDILINQLENSIEIKALAKDKVYSKILNVNLPILKYGLLNGNLILELQGK